MLQVGWSCSAPDWLRLLTHAPDAATRSPGWGSATVATSAGMTLRSRGSRMSGTKGAYDGSSTSSTRQVPSVGCHVTASTVPVTVAQGATSRSRLGL